MPLLCKAQKRKQRNTRTSKTPQLTSADKSHVGNSSLVQQMQALINERWNLRFNELENNIELQLKGDEDDTEFKLMTERSHNSLIMHVQNTLPQCYRSWIDGYLYSDAIPSYHPLQHYLDNLPRWDKRNRLTEVAQMVSHDDLWVKVFSRWMRAMVAGWLNEGEKCEVFQNQIAPPHSERPPRHG